MTLEVSWDGLWTLSFGLSQFLGHSTRLVCKMTLINFNSQKHDRKHPMNPGRKVLDNFMINIDSIPTL